VPPRKRAGEGAGGVLPRSRTRTRSPAARPILRGTSLRRPGARARGGRRLSRKSAAADSTSGPAASPDVAAHEPAARPPIGRWGGGRRAKSTTAREAQAKCRARARGSVGRVAAAGGSPAPSARLMSARRGVLSRDDTEEGAGDEIPRQRTRTRNLAASPDVAAHERTAPAGQSGERAAEGDGNRLPRRLCSREPRPGSHGSVRRVPARAPPAPRAR